MCALRLPSDRALILRHRAARHVAARGPAPTAELAAALGLPLRDVRAVTNHPWFRITGDGWALTLNGRAELSLARLAA